MLILLGIYGSYSCSLHFSPQWSLEYWVALMTQSQFCNQYNCISNKYFLNSDPFSLITLKNTSFVGVSLCYHRHIQSSGSEVSFWSSLELHLGSLGFITTMNVLLLYKCRCIVWWFQEVCLPTCRKVICQRF